MSLICHLPDGCSFSGGTVIGDLAPHEAFPIGGTNSVRGYDEGAVGSGRSCVVASAEISVPLVSADALLCLSLSLARSICECILKLLSASASLLFSVYCCSSLL